MQKTLAIASAMLLSSLLAGPALAQTVTTQTTKTVRTGTMDTVGPHNPYCGAWVNDTWTPNGNCVSETTTTTTTTRPAAPANATTVVVAPPANRRIAERISGKIVGVNGNMVTLQRGDRTMIVDDSRALDRQDTGRVATGRVVIAHGYWQDGTFYASSFE
jgi:hypothetical protein